MLGAAPLGGRDKINIGIAFPIATAARAQYLMPFYHLCLEKNGSKFTPLAKTAATFCKMPWMWQGRVEKMPRTLQLWGRSGEGVWTPGKHQTPGAEQINPGNSLEVKLGCLGQGSCTTASIQGLHRGDFSLRPIHQGLARYFGGFSAQLQIIAMVTDASHDNFVTSETRNSCLKIQASSRNGDIYFLLFFSLGFIVF